MRIRKRFHSLISPPDLSSPPPRSMAATAAAAAQAISTTGAAGGKQGEVIAAVGGLQGSGVGSGGRGAAGGGGRGLHPHGNLPAQAFHGCNTMPTFSLHSHHPLLRLEEATPKGEESGDLPTPGLHLLAGDVPFDTTHGGEAPKQEQEGENGADGYTHSGATAAAPKSLGAQVPELSLGHGGYKTHPNSVAATSAKAEDMARWSDEGRCFQLKKRRGCYRARRAQTGGEEEEEEENVVAKREMKSRPSIHTKERRTALSSNATTPAAIRTTLTPAGTASVGAPTATGASATKKCDDVVAKEEGGDMLPAVVNGNGKKRRSPAVLMEGSRCSRVNGRGWRCCQQTLVGYSLCEHHLGKGRLRSVSSVRFNGRARKREEVDGAAQSQLPSPVQQQQQLLSLEEGEDEEEEPGKRRGKKIGTVKARSITSLLHQSDCSTPTKMAGPEPFASPHPAPAPTAISTAATAPLDGSDSVVA